MKLSRLQDEEARHLWGIAVDELEAEGEDQNHYDYWEDSKRAFEALLENRVLTDHQVGLLLEEIRWHRGKVRQEHDQYQWKELTKLVNYLLQLAIRRGVVQGAVR